MPRAVAVLLTLGFAAACQDPPPPAATVPAPEPAPEPAAQPTEEPNEAEPADCPPLSVTVNGEAVEVPHGFAVRSSGGLSVTLLNHDQVGCEQMLEGAWASPAGQVWTVARHTADRGWVSFGNRNTHGEVEVIREPGEVGEPVVLCVREPVEWGRGVGQPAATVVGRYEGQYCGERSRP